MSNFTREQIIEAAKQCLSGKVCYDCPLAYEDCDDVKSEFILSLTTKENEPAPSANDTSSKDNSIIDILYNTVKKIELCSADSWSRGYCKGVRETVDKLNNKQ